MNPIFHAKQNNSSFFSLNDFSSTYILDNNLTTSKVLELEWNILILPAAYSDHVQSN